MLSLLAGKSHSDSWQFLMDIWSRGLLVIPTQSKLLDSSQLTARCAGMQIFLSQSGALKLWYFSTLTIRDACQYHGRASIYWLFPQYLFQMQSLILNTFTNTGLNLIDLIMSVSLWNSIFSFEMNYKAGLRSAPFPTQNFLLLKFEERKEYSINLLAILV